ncbi:MAG: hypothetical protein GKS00_22005 [Alphaproteobacteria bacterium]|nr:hypothetical protein [Alphaproteobacteria bacterium]
MDALVAFHDHGAFWFSRHLRWGFRHVFVVTLNDGYWVMLDGRDGVPVLEVVAGVDFDLAAFYRKEHGFTVLRVTAPGLPPCSPVMLGTCVGAVKRVLGLRAPWVLTPYQLYRYLKRRQR